MQENKDRQYFYQGEKQAMRDGPRPLSVHINMAMAEKAAGAVGDADIKKFLQGIKKYQLHSFRRHTARYDTLWKDKGALLHYVPALKNTQDSDIKQRVGLFIVPSLINDTDIFDLLPEKSFVRWMGAKGIDIYILDWGTIEKGHSETSESELFNDYIFPAIQAACVHSRSNDNQGRLFGMGYCMGGTLLTAALCDKRAKGLEGAVLLASPWDFEAGDRALANRVKALKVNAAQMLLQKDKALPVDMVQSVFASLMPSQTIRKFSQFYEMENGGIEEKIFIATEDWLNNGRNIPQGIARSIVFDWYDSNKTAHNLWRPYGDEICPDNINVPVLLLASRRDRLVPYDSTRILEEKIKNSTLYDPDCGHIGFMAGRNAEEKVWKTVYEWLVRQTASS